MNKVKTNLFALAAGVLISPAIMAGDINSATTKTAYADEALGFAGANDMIEGGNLIVILGAEFTVNDVITLNFSGEALDPDSLTTTIETVDTVCESGPCSTVTLGQLNATNAQTQYRITEIDSAAPAGNTTVGLEIDFGVLMFDPAEVLAAGGVNVKYTARTNNNLVLDSSDGPDIAAPCAPDCNATETDIIQTGAYFGVDPTPAFDAVVDVNTGRTTLVVGPSDTGGFSATLTDFVTGKANAEVLVTFLSHEPTFTGDFSWITDPDDAVADGVVAFSPASGCAPADIVVTQDEITAECTGALAVLTLDPSAQSPLTVLPAKDYSAQTNILYEDIYFGSSDTDTLMTPTFGLGKWGLNGFQAEVAYMPFQSGIGQVIYFANRSAQTGEITVDWIDQDANSGSFPIGDSVAGSTRAIGNAIRTGLPPAQQNGGRLALTITVNVPACDGQLNAQYNVSGDRAFSTSRSNCPIDAVIVP